jgi:hypothetical protein
MNDKANEQVNIFKYCDIMYVLTILIWYKSK